MKLNRYLRRKNKIGPQALPPPEKASRTKEEIEKDMGFASAKIGQLFHQQKCIEIEMNQWTQKLHGFCHEINKLLEQEKQNDVCASKET